MEYGIEADRGQSQHRGLRQSKIDQPIEDNLRYYSGRSREEIAHRIGELENEWDIERVLEMMAASFSLTGLTLGVLPAQRTNSANRRLQAG